ncbi:MAG: hypothetical protein ACJAVV_001009 [Alphaproteobacteria bacterium]|jgi:hypothetical protein
MKGFKTVLIFTELSIIAAQENTRLNNTTLNEKFFFSANYSLHYKVIKGFKSPLYNYLIPQRL